MTGLIGFFLGGPARVQALLITAGVAMAAGLGLLTWGLYWRGEYREAQVEITVLQAQTAILADATAACSAGVAEAKKSSDAALRTGAALLAEARKLHGNVPAVVTELRDLISKDRRPDGSAKDCRDAWREIEDLERKAGRAP